MTPWHIAILITVAFCALWLGIVVGLLITAKRADEDIDNMFDAICTRPAPHVCRVNGPCNGLPREQDSEHFTAWLQEWERKSKEKQ